MSSLPTLLPGQSPPISVVTPTDQAGVLFIITALGVAFGLMSLIVRVYIRASFSRAYGLDDVFIGVAFIFSVFQSATVFVAVERGLGRTLDDIDPRDLIPIQKAFYASDILYIATLWLAKCSVAFLYLRLSSASRHAIASRTALGSIATLGVVSTFVVAFSCEASHPWAFIGNTCSAQSARWSTVAAFDIVTEIFLFGLPLFIVGGLQMPFSRKFAITLGFAFRLLLLAPIIVRLCYLVPALKSDDPTLKLEFAVVNAQVEILWSIVAATIPCLGPFMNAQHTSWGGHGETMSTSSYNNSSREAQVGKASVVVLESKKSPLTSRTSIREIGSRLSTRLSSSNHNSQNRSQDIPLSIRTANGWVSEDQRSINGPQEADVENGNDSGGATGKEDGRSMRSSDSQQMIIRRDIEWSVQYQGERPPSEHPQRSSDSECDDATDHP